MNWLRRRNIFNKSWISSQGLVGFLTRVAVLTNLKKAQGLRGGSVKKCCDFWKSRISILEGWFLVWQPHLIKEFDEFGLKSCDFYDFWKKANFRPPKTYSCAKILIFVIFWTSPRRSRHPPDSRANWPKLPNSTQQQPTKHHKKPPSAPNHLFVMFCWMLLGWIW